MIELIYRLFCSPESKRWGAVLLIITDLAAQPDVIKYRTYYNTLVKRFNE